MPQSDLRPGDFLVFQLEAAYGLLRLLAIGEFEAERIWHLAAYADLFPTIELAEAALTRPEGLLLARPHLILTDRAFDSTEVATIGYADLTDAESRLPDEWHPHGPETVSDSPVRILLGYR